SGATDALFLFSIISKTGLEKSEDFSRPVLFLETYVTASLDITSSTLVDRSPLLMLAMAFQKSTMPLYKSIENAASDTNPGIFLAIQP
ncbi:hypothetical protein, partial [Lactiplantibacillus plantarum]